MLTKIVLKAKIILKAKKALKYHTCCVIVIVDDRRGVE